MQTVHSHPAWNVPSPAHLTAGAADRVLLVDNLTPVNAGGSHEFFTATRRDNGEAIFIKHNKVNQVFKHGTLKAINPVLLAVADRVFPRLDRLQDMTETMFSHFLKGYCDMHHQPYAGVTYQEVLFVNPRDGQPTLGIAAPVVPHLTTLNDVDAARIANPAQAVETTLVRGLLFGDYDVALHDENTTVIKTSGTMSDGQPVAGGQALAMDFGEAGNPRIEGLGIPFANQKLLRQYPQHIQPALDRILALDRAQVRHLVEVAGEHVTGWTPALTERYTGIVGGNLERLRQRLARDPHWLDPNRSRNWFRQPELHDFKLWSLAFRCVLPNYGRVKSSGILEGVPDNQAVASTLAGVLPLWATDRAKAD